MASYQVEIKNVQGLAELKANFDFTDNRIVVITGKNGTGKTTLVKAFKLVSDPQVFKKTSNVSSIGEGSHISYNLNGNHSFSFSYNSKIKSLDSKETLPLKGSLLSELPIPYGDRFQQFSLVAKYDSDIRADIASSNYTEAGEICDFLSSIYPENKKFSDLKEVSIKKNLFYFILQDNDYYIREDHFSSGEFFLIQLYRLITSKAELIIIDELDVSLDASAQVHIFNAIQPLLTRYNSYIILISHSLAFMETVNDGCLYYHEENNGVTTLEQRSFGYIKSDLYGFKGRDRYIITEDLILEGFIKYLLRFYNIVPFFEFEIILAGGQPQIDTLVNKNDAHEIFSSPENVIVLIDKDIKDQIKYKGASKVYTSPVEDIELFIWLRREEFLSDVNIAPFQAAKKDKDTAKTYWKKVIRSGQKSEEDLFQLVINTHADESESLSRELSKHLCL